MEGKTTRSRRKERKTIWAERGKDKKNMNRMVGKELKRLGIFIEGINVEKRKKRERSTKKKKWRKFKTNIKKEVV